MSRPARYVTDTHSLLDLPTVTLDSNTPFFDSIPQPTSRLSPESPPPDSKFEVVHATGWSAILAKRWKPKSLKALLRKSVRTHGRVSAVGRLERGESRSPITFGERTSTIGERTSAIGDSTAVMNPAGAPYCFSLAGYRHLSDHLPPLALLRQTQQAT